MINCIFSGYCTEKICDNACPVLAESTYLLERNNINIQSANLRNLSYKRVLKLQKYIDSAINDNKLCSCIEAGSKSFEVSEQLIYCCCCKFWKGNQFEASVYNIKFGSYLDKLKASWKTKTDDFEFLELFLKKSKLLIVSSLDLMKFKDFESQILLNILHSRYEDHLYTIVVVPSVSSLNGEGPFYGRLISELSECKEVDEK